MATYIQGLTDQVPVIQPFQPDFGMVQKALTTLQSKYDQGFASVQNAYNQVLNAPLSNLKLREYRDDYVKDSEKKLKDLSSVDLSLYENQAAAENVFAPFWKDERFLTDTYLTKNIQSETQKGFNARDSKDDKIRSQYNPLSTDYLQNGLEELRNADPDSPNFTKIQPRRWVPFTDLQSYLEEQADKQKLEIKWTSPSGPYLVTTHNGPRSLTSFQAWAHDMIGNKFTDQFRVMGTVEREDGIKTLMRNDPTLTEDQATDTLARNVMKGLDKGYADRSKDLDESLKKADAQLEWYLGKPATEDVKAEIQRIRSEQRGLSQQKEDLTKVQNNFKSSSDVTLDQIKKNPDGYYADLNKQRAVNEWAGARAANQSQDIELNPLLKQQDERNYRIAEIQEKYAEISQKDRQLQAHHMIDTDGDGIADAYSSGIRGGGAPGGYGSFGGYEGFGGYGTPGGTGGAGSKKFVQTVLSGHNIGPGDTDISKIGNAYEVLKNEQDNLWMMAHQNFFDLNGLGRVLTSSLGIKDDLARNYANELQRKMQDPEHYTIDNKGGWYKGISDQLEKESGVHISTPVDARNALATLAGRYLKEKLKDGGKFMGDDDDDMLQKYLTGMSALQQYESTEQNIKDQVEKIFNTSHDYDVMRQDHNGKPGIITSDDLAKTFKLKKYNINGTDVSPAQFARFYMQGQIKLESRNTDALGAAPSLSQHFTSQDGIITIGTGKDKAVVHVDGQSDSNTLFKELMSLDNKYGSSENFQKKLGDLNQKIVPGVFEYQNKTGIYGYKMQYAIQAGENDKFAVDLLHESSNSDNMIAIYDGDKQSKDPDINSSITNLLKQPQPVMEKYISAVTVNTHGPNNSLALELTFAPFSSKDNTVTGEGSEDFKKVADKKISILLNPHATTQAIQDLRINPGFYVYGDFLRGKKMEADPMLQAVGFDCSILPNDSKDPTYVRFSLKRKVIDPTTGESVPVDGFNRDLSFKEKTPDEIMGLYFYLLKKHLRDNAEAYKIFSNSSAAKKLQTGREYYNELLKNEPPITQ